MRSREKNFGVELQRESCRCQDNFRGPQPAGGSYEQRIVVGVGVVSRSYRKATRCQCGLFETCEEKLMLLFAILAEVWSAFQVGAFSGRLGPATKSEGWSRVGVDDHVL